MPEAGAPQVHCSARSCHSATLSQEGDVDDLAGSDLFSLAGNHHQTVCLSERRQQMR
ncbi:hypothetical protein I553_4280 [Mycobacterium xenopi 4042]|uniref:Uncharacterized protein n=1 Tax=Mycobacterium xenopi 4042 TaxID=1299334 RepID=X8AER3_MYCXE|nr:hypothetical protein I553_4280 [Mycobacterium xenopi 4042]